MLPNISYNNSSHFGASIARLKKLKRNESIIRTDAHVMLERLFRIFHNLTLNFNDRRKKKFSF